MSSCKYPTAAILACLLLFGTACEREGSSSSSPSTSGSEFAIAALSGVPLRDQEGKRLEPSTLAGKTVLVNFMFTSCPKVCPDQVRALARVQAALPADVRANVRLLSISVDPENDDPARLKAFAVENHARLESWSFVVASAEGTRTLSQRLGMFDQRSEELSPSAHATGVYLFDGAGQMRQRYAGLPIDESRLLLEVPKLVRLRPDARLPR